MPDHQGENNQSQQEAKTVIRPAPGGGGPFSPEDQQRPHLSDTVERQKGKQGPDFIPVIGYLDDLLLLPLGIWLAIRLVPQEVWEECQALAVEQVNKKPKIIL